MFWRRAEPSEGGPRAAGGLLAPYSSAPGHWGCFGRFHLPRDVVARSSEDECLVIAVGFRVEQRLSYRLYRLELLCERVVTVGGVVLRKTFLKFFESA